MKFIVVFCVEFILVVLDFWVLIDVLDSKGFWRKVEKCLVDWGVFWYFYMSNGVVVSFFRVLGIVNRLVF